jgi:hypothetical protein
MPTLTGTARNIAFAHFDWVQQPGVTLSGATWSASLPLANLQNYKLSRVARSVAPNALKPTVLVDFGANRRLPVTGLAVPKHNLSRLARWRIRLGSDPAFPPTSTLYDSRPMYGTTASLTAVAVAAPQTVTLAVADALTFCSGASVRLKAVADPAVLLEGAVLGYDNNAKAVTVNVTSAQGSGAYSDWTVERLAADIPVWPQVRQLGQGWWGADYTWGGLLDVDAGFRPPAIHLIPLVTGSTVPYHPRYCLIEFDDAQPSANPDGFIDLGKLVISPVWQPSVNLQYGWELEFVDQSPQVRSRGGQHYVDVRPKYRKLTLTLSHLGQDEMLTQAYELDRRLGVGLPLTVIVDPADGTHLHRLAIYGSLVRTSPIRHDTFQGFSKTYEIVEWL